MGGLDNLRDYTKRMSHAKLPIYAVDDIHDRLIETYPYIFKKQNIEKTGGVPDLYLESIKEKKTITINDIQLHRIEWSLGIHAH